MNAEIADDAEIAAGRVLLVGLPGPDLDPATAARLARLQPAGVILFARNLTSPECAVALLADVRATIPGPAWLAVDQEGGRVSRLERWIGPTPRAAQLARGGAAAARAFGRATAEALAALGFNIDFAPVVDVCPPEIPNGIGDRSFSAEPEAVAELAGAFLAGLQGHGVAGCLKHFPGLGPTAVDSHVELPVAAGGAERLERVDLVPFRRLADRAAAVMVGHAHYPALEPAAAVPASLSQVVVTGKLRAEVGFTGLAIADDLEMGAVAPLDRDGAAAVRAIEAGCELLLYCADLDRAQTARRRLAERARDDARFHTRLLAAASRVEQAATRWPPSSGDPRALDLARSGMAGIARELGALS